LFKKGKSREGSKQKAKQRKRAKTRRNKEERLQEQKQKNSTLCRNGVMPFLGKQNKMAPNIKHKNKNWYYMIRCQRQQPLSHNSNTFKIVTVLK
jgi:hypothetical protein